MPELQYAVKKMKNRKSEDMSHTVTELIKHADGPFFGILLDMYNSILTTGNTPSNWHVTVFRMLPKTGDLSDANNWRPIAVLPILYKIFSKLVYARLHPVLEKYQSHDQFGFRIDRRIDDVFGIVENMIGKCGEWNLPVWICTLDLRKAFDRILHQPLFEILRHQNIHDGYLHLLGVLYKGQKGTIDGKHFFDIQWGVKQGDTLSAMLFNAAIQEVFVRWEKRLSSEGWLLKTSTERLTNGRYADDILLFAHSREELQTMIELLIEELRKICLELNASKTKILTNEIQEQQFILVGDVQINIVPENENHKYLGRYLLGAFENRSIIEVAHRLQCGWHKFGRHANVLLNKNVSIKLRLKLFDSAVTPSLLFGLHVLPISKISMDKIMICQRKMLRKNVGWTRRSQDSWEIVMRAMKTKIQNAMTRYYVRPWDECIQEKKISHFDRLTVMHDGRWGKLSMQWEPTKVQDLSLMTMILRTMRMLMMMSMVPYLMLMLMLMMSSMVPYLRINWDTE